MSALPIRRGQFKTAKFAAWLAEQGAEIGTPTNPYEVIRYRAFNPNGSKPATHIVYAKESGLLNYQGSSRKHYETFLAGGKLERAFVSQFDPKARDGFPPDRTPKQTTREKLLDRDGDECWFCGEAMGADVTIEHLVPKSKGGRNALANYALAHAACNHAAADMPLVDKIAMRARMRAESADA